MCIVSNEVVLDQSYGLGAQMIGHRRLCGPVQLDGLVKLMGHVSGPQECVC